MKDLHDLQLAGAQLSGLCSNDSRQLTFHLYLMMFGLRFRELKAFDALWLKKEVALETEKKEEAKMLAYVGLRVFKTSPQVTLARHCSMSSTSSHCSSKTPISVLCPGNNALRCRHLARVS